MGLAVVRSLDAPRSLQSVQEQEDFEQELVDQFLLAAVGAGMGDAMVNENRSVIFEFARFLGRPLWTPQPPMPTRSWPASAPHWAGPS